MDPTTSGDFIEDLAVRGNDLYLAGADALASAGRWRYERRDARSGVLRSHCATNAATPSGVAEVIAADDEGPVVAGTSKDPAESGAPAVLERRLLPGN